MKIIVAGLAKTGTTGLFYKIRNSMEGSPRMLFEPRVYEPRPRDEADGVLAKVLVGRAGYADYDSFDSFDKKVCIIRDPRDRLVSSLLYSSYGEAFIDDDEKLERFIDTLREKERDSGSVSVAQIAALHEELSDRPVQRVATAMSHFTDILAAMVAFCSERPDYFQLKYEDFVTDRLESLADHLGFALAGDSDVEASLERVVRTKGMGDWKHWLVAEDVEILRNDPRITDYMTRFGYDDDWELAEAPEISPGHCSEYVLRLVAEKRGTKPAPEPATRPKPLGAEEV